MEKEIENEIIKLKKKLVNLKKILFQIFKIFQKILASNIIENISGDKLNESSIKAAVEDVQKKI